MKDLLTVLVQVQALLARAGFDSIVIGGLAVAAWGEPRLTRDVDLKVGALRGDIDRMVDGVAPEFVPAGPEAVPFARRSGVLFLQSVGAIRVDLLLSEAGFDSLALSRGVQAEVAPGVSARLCSPEDLVLYKLISTRARDRDDAETVLRRQGRRLDHGYLEDMLRQFEEALDDSTLLDTYRELRERASGSAGCRMEGVE